MTFDHLHFDRDAHVALLTINRPAVRNALSLATLDDLRRAILECGSRTDIAAVVITGAGDKAFAAGADIRELASLTPPEAKAYALRGQHVFDLVANLGKPVIAAINGYALGGGCELAMACTLRIASESAILGQPEIHLGALPGYAGTQRLPRLVGRATALELLLTGRQIPAAEALRIGLVNRVVADGTVVAEAKVLAADLATRAPVAMRYIIEAVNRGLEMPFDKGEFLEASLFGLAAATADMREGTSAFLEKRKPVFKGS